MDKFNEYDMLDYIFSFLKVEDNQELDPVLSGYFSDVIS